ncbi:MAG TPA: glycosyltransferase family 1 protein, partial [Allosphingosinicella sp.]|nr:glycosyltransferase family 1 protein [Allosphingosinicella sp.]
VGLPVVAAIAIGSQSLVIDGVSGRLLRGGAIEAFADALAHYCQDEAARREAGAAGARAAQRYGWDQVNQQLVDGYLRIIRQHSAGVRRRSSPVP